MKLASYKSTRPGFQGIANRLIRLRLRSIYSHNEIVFEPGDGVDHLMPDGTCEPDADGALWCASSVAAERMPSWSRARAGRVGGVRFKRIKLNPDHWDERPTDRCPLFAAQWFSGHEGELYDWQLIVGFLAWAIPQKSLRWTCSETGSAALGVAEAEAWRLDPAGLDAVVLALASVRTQ